MYMKPLSELLQKSISTGTLPSERKLANTNELSNPCLGSHDTGCIKAVLATADILLISLLDKIQPGVFDGGTVD
ncbi:hypothetical protein DPMN_181923 [Dreissena polymorpha]|uniref:Uncharacterized protein n=1 Tax=Dreissena polymorpha TaxID=45954 RepID=A0A9D4DEM2_DREPO|nr:hypothetical protein DPMN_181923 [Dreissena polymorpha]